MHPNMWDHSSIPCLGMVPVYVSAALSFDTSGQGPKVHSSSFSAWVKSQGSAAECSSNIYPGWADKSIGFVMYAC